MLSKECRKALCEKVIERIEASGGACEDEVDEIIDEVIVTYSKETYLSLSDKLEARKRILDSVKGYDILQDPIDDPEITEIMVNGQDDIFIEKNGSLSRYDGCFESREKIDDVVQKIAAGANRIINEASPIVDARLEDGSRVHMILPPVALNGPVITIRKFPHKAMTIEKLIDLNALNCEAADFLRKVVIAGYNIFVSGGTGSGKTTFLNALSGFIPEDERLITIEDSAELMITQIPNRVRLEVRNANVEGKNGISVRDLIKASLRMRPDRIVVGEVRDGACFDMLQALNTGHSGMSTGHANSAEDMLSRLEAMVLQAAEIPLPAVRKQIASAIDIIIQLGRFRDKSRKVVEITEVTGFEDNEIKLNPLYRFIETGEEEGKIIGELKSTGNKLLHREKLIEAGLE